MQSKEINYSCSNKQYVTAFYYVIYIFLHFNKLISLRQEQLLSCTQPQEGRTPRIGKMVDSMPTFHIFLWVMSKC